MERRSRGPIVKWPVKPQGMRRLDSKHEIRNPQLETNSNEPIHNVPNIAESNSRFWSFGSGIYFGPVLFRISKFGFKFVNRW
jgi:hypothetical protein